MTLKSYIQSSRYKTIESFRNFGERTMVNNGWMKEYSTDRDKCYMHIHINNM